MTPELTIIIPTWNHFDLLAECLDALRRQTFTRFEILIIDDGSTEDITQLAATRYPEARILRREPNGGFAKAVNTGLRAAQAPLIFLLNNDMVLEPDCLEHLIHAAQTTTAALFAPIVLHKDNPALLYGAGDAQRCDGIPQSIGFRQPAATFPLPPAIFGISAGAGLYRREIFQTIGLLDETFTAYFEDSDLNFRARLAGFDAALVPQARAHHAGSASITGRTWWRARQCYRNHALLILKNMPAPLIWRHARCLIAGRRQQRASAFSAARAQFGALRAALILIHTLIEIITLLPHIFITRHAIQRRRAIPLETLDHLLDHVPHTRSRFSQKS